MEVDAWSEWAGSAPQARPGVPVSAGSGDLDDLYDLVVTRAARLAGTGDAPSASPAGRRGVAGGV